jgi:hypothetical protein
MQLPVLHQVQEMFECMEKGKKDVNLQAESLRRGASYLGSSKPETDEVVSRLTRHVVVKRSNGDEPQVKVGPVVQRVSSREVALPLHSHMRTLVWTLPGATDQRGVR